MIIIEGFLLQMGLILALGPQNIYVLNAGLRKRRPLSVATLCATFDVLFIFSGVFGVSMAFKAWPLFQTILSAVGVLFLLTYAVLKLREAFVDHSKDKLSVQFEESTWKILATAMGFTVLNPHVYLDTIVLVGGYSGKFTQFNDRLDFAIGASVASVFWFYALAIAASWLSPLMAYRAFGATVNLVSGLLLLFIGCRLGLEWIKKVPAG